MLPNHFGGMGGDLSGGPVVVAAKVACRRIKRTDADSIQEVVSRIYEQLFDPNIARFDPARGTVPAYLKGLAYNAAKGLVGRGTETITESIEAPASSELSLEDQEFLGLAYQVASRDVQWALVRLQRGETLEMAAKAGGRSRRSLKRAIDKHVERCHGMMASAAA